MDKTKVQTETLAGDALNWAVMNSEGLELTPVLILLWPLATEQ
ncbi:hypothetical protein [Pseudomonas serbica]|nr:hypothetical protein [Pseudomonas serbica]